MPTGNEEKVKQGLLQRLNNPIDPPLEFRLREQHAGEEGAEGHRKPSLLGRQRRAKNGEKHQGCETTRVA